MENKQSKSTQPSSSIFTKASSWLFSKLKNGIFGSFFTSYEKTNKKFTNAIKKKNGSGEKRAKRAIARAIEKSPLVNTVPKLQDFLLRVSVRDYGLVLFTMALFTCAMFFVQDYVYVIHSSIANLVAATIILVLSLPMLFFKKSLADVLLNSRIFHSLLFDFLGLRDEGYSSASDEKPHESPSIALLSGLILSVFAYFLGPLWTIAIIVTLFFAYQVLITPEAGVIIVILALPFTSTIVMSIMELYVAICYIIKCVVGRRTFKFEYADLWMLIMITIVFIGGFVSFDVGSSSKDMLLTIVLLASFFVISNLIRSKEWFRRCIVAITITATISSAIGIAQFILGKLEITWDAFKAFSKIHERIPSTFADADSFALFLVACLPFLLLFVFSGKTASSKVIGLICSLINITALALTYSKIGYIGALAMLVLLLIIFNKNCIYILLIGIGTIVMLNFVLPPQAFEAISSIVALPTNTHAYRLMLFDASMDMIVARPFGVGLGSTAFSLAHGALVGGEAISNSGNLYLQIAISCGILGLILFICSIIVLFRLSLSYAVKTTNKFRRINALAGFCSAFGILISGFFGYAFADKTILAIFCVCIALTFSYIKAEREENNSPSRIFVDVLSASIDIDVEKSTTSQVISTRKYVRSPKKRKTSKVIEHDSAEIDAIKPNEFDIDIHDDN